MAVIGIWLNDIPLRDVHVTRERVNGVQEISVQLRQLFTQLGGFSIEWIGATQRVIVRRGTTELRFRIGTNTFDRTVDGVDDLDIPLGGYARLEPDPTNAGYMLSVIPLIAPLEALGYTIRTGFSVTHTTYVISIYGSLGRDMMPPLQPTDPSTSPEYVLLSAIVTKNGGDSAQRAESVPNGVRRYVEVRLKGITREFTVGVHVFYNNGFVVIPRSLLMSEFGLTEHQATHQSWDSFGSMDAAALAFSLMWTQHGTNIDREMGAIIYRDRWSSYTFGSVWEGAQDNVVWGLVSRVISPEIHVQLGGMSRVALAHTHPANSRAFSIEDMDLAHGRFDLRRWLGSDSRHAGVRIPGMTVYMSVIMNETRLEVARFDNTMDRFDRDARFGREVFVK